MGSSDVPSSRVVSVCILYFKLALTECVGIVFSVFMCSTGVNNYSKFVLAPVGTSLVWNSNKGRERAFMGRDFDSSTYLVL